MVERLAECGAIRPLKVGDGAQHRRILSQFTDNMRKAFGAVTVERIADVLVAEAYTLAKGGEGKYGLSRLVGPEAVERAVRMKRGFKFYQDTWLKDCGVTRDELIRTARDRSVHPLDRFIYMPAEDTTKAAHLNTRAGFLKCRLSTSGWSPESPACARCRFAAQCGKDLRELNPELHRLRKERHDERTGD